MTHPILGAAFDHYHRQPRFGTQEISLFAWKSALQHVDALRPGDREVKIKLLIGMVRLSSYLSRCSLSPPQLQD